MIVSIVTPTLNAMKYLGEAIDSARRQASNKVEVEHIVVDGGSTDGTVEYARAQGCTVMKGKDEGIFDAINKGSFASKGVLLGFLGCDDILLPGALEMIVEAFEKTRRPWVVGACRWMDATGAARGDISAPPSWMTAPMHASLGWSAFPHLSTYMHREFFEQLNGFDKSYKYSGDYELFTRAVDRESFARVQNTLSCARRHGANQSMTENSAHAAEITRIEQRFAPASARKRTVYRYLLKLWMNGRNPSWFAWKRIDAFNRRFRTASTSS